LRRPPAEPFGGDTDGAADTGHRNLIDRSRSMQTFAIRRRSNWKDASELSITAGVSARVGNEEMPDRVRWIRSYVVREDDGRLGTVCIYQGTDLAAIREHARRAGMSADEIVPVEDTVVIREDPVAEAAGVA
jgi:hypothetical protein